MVNFELFDPEKYYDSLLEEIPRAKKRIVIAAMVVLWGERTAPIFIMLQDAVKRGVSVTVMIDNYTRLTYLHDLKPASSGKERLRQTFRILGDMSAEGATIHNFGKIGFSPFKGRSHVKITVVDDISYSFGGINFFDEQLTNTDYMLMSKNPKVADCLEQLVDRVIKTRPPLHDGEVVIDRHTKILFDGGRPDYSIIYERACELASQATNIYYVSQMVPSGQLARLLKETESAVYTNRPEQMSAVAGIGQAFDQQKHRIRNSYTGQGYIHAKTILFEMPRGRKALLSGSNNFSYRGVNFGTQEICLHSTDPDLWAEMYKFLDKKIFK